MMLHCLSLPVDFILMEELLVDLMLLYAVQLNAKGFCCIWYEYCNLDFFKEGNNTCLLLVTTSPFDINWLRFQRLEEHCWFHVLPLPNIVLLVKSFVLGQW